MSPITIKNVGSQVQFGVVDNYKKVGFAFWWCWGCVFLERNDDDDDKGGGSSEVHNYHQTKSDWQQTFETPQGCGGRKKG